MKDFTFLLNHSFGLRGLNYYHANLRCYDRELFAACLAEVTVFDRYYLWLIVIYYLVDFKNHEKFDFG